MRCHHFCIVKIIAECWFWYRCQNRIEKYYHHDGEQLTFYQKVHIKTQAEKERFFSNLCIAINPNVFDKIRTQDNVKCHIQHEGSWLRWIVIDHRKLQVTLLFAYISWKKFCWHTFKASSEGVIVMRF